jgi:hypothetical protein
MRAVLLCFLIIALANATDQCATPASLYSAPGGNRLVSNQCAMAKLTLHTYPLAYNPFKASLVSSKGLW